MSQKNKIALKDLVGLIEQIKDGIRIKNKIKITSWYSRLFESIRDRSILEKNLDHFLDQTPLSSGALYVKCLDLAPNANYYSLHKALTIRGLMKNPFTDDKNQIELSEYQKCLLVETYKNAGLYNDIDQIFFI